VENPMQTSAPLDALAVFGPHAKHGYARSSAQFRHQLDLPPGNASGASQALRAGRPVSME